MAEYLFNVLMIVLFVVPISVCSVYMICSNKPKRLIGSLIILIPYAIGISILYVELFEGHSLRSFL